MTLRIVSLLPSATEILFALGIGDRVVGVTHECDYPPEACTRPRLTSSALPPGRSSAATDRHVKANLHAGSSIYHLDAQQLKALRPDIIFTQELCAVCAVSYSIVTAAARALPGEPRIISLEPSTLADVYANIETVGELTGVAGAAQRLVAKLRQRESRLQVLTIGLQKPRTLVLEWTDPPMNAGHWTPGLVELAGGTAVLANPGANSQPLRWTDIAREDPDRIIVAPCGFDLEITAREAGNLSSNSIWEALPAVHNGNTALVDGNAYVNRPGPRLLDSAEIFATIIHPQLRDQLPQYSKGWCWLNAVRT